MNAEDYTNTTIKLLESDIAELLSDLKNTYNDNAKEVQSAYYLFAAAMASARAAFKI